MQNSQMQLGIQDRETPSLDPATSLQPRHFTSPAPGRLYWHIFCLGGSGRANILPLTGFCPSIYRTPFEEWGHKD